jgi:hypothetical protein
MFWLGRPSMARSLPADEAPEVVVTANESSRTAIPTGELESKASRGAGTRDDATVTGEKVPLQRKQRVPGGALEGDSIATLRLTRPGSDPDQIRVNEAIERGVNYLRSHAWEGQHHEVGYVALAGLTLLECGVPATDIKLHNAAALVRFQSGPLNQTYELALAVLFLDRLGLVADRPLIKGLALRLMAGQNLAGGWTYHCPLLPPGEAAQLYKFLESQRPLAKPLQVPGPAEMPKLLAGTPANGNELPPPNLILDPRHATVPTPMRPESLPVHLRTLPIVVLQSRQVQLTSPKDDNSNTQFALLALWVARRHDVPTESALLAAAQRFRNSQAPDGHWDYNLHGHHTGPAMTAVGLLGLAMGHGVDPALRLADQARVDRADENIQNGLQYLGGQIGVPARGQESAEPLPGLYFLWSVERVGVLYDQKTIGGKDWYTWGATLLLQHQRPDGSWFGGHYPGSSAHLDTCLALLFLKRSNLVQDLTADLRLYMPIRDPAAVMP